MAGVAELAGADVWIAFAADGEPRTAHGVPALATVAVAYRKGSDVNNIIYIIGLIVVILAVLSFFGFR